MKQSGQQQNGTTLQRHEITKNDSAPNVLAEKESSTQTNEEGVPMRNSVSPLQNVVPIESIIAPLKNETHADNETSLFRNKITPIQNEVKPAPNENTELSQSPNATASSSTNTSMGNLTADTKEGMKDLGEAIGSLFGGLFSAMMPLMNATANTSNIFSANNSNNQQLNDTQKDKSLLSKERSELNGKFYLIRFL